MDKLMKRERRKNYIKRSKILLRFFCLLPLIIVCLGILTHIIFNTNYPTLGKFSLNVSTVLIVITFVFAFISMHRIGIINTERSKLRVNKFNLHLNRFYNMLENNEFDKIIDYYNSFVSVDVTNGIDKMSSHIAQGFLIGKLNENLDKLDNRTKKVVVDRLNLYKEYEKYEYK